LQRKKPRPGIEKKVQDLENEIKRLKKQNQATRANLKTAQAKLQKSSDRLRKTMGGIIQAMSLTIEKRDPYTAGHQRRVTKLCRAIATTMGFSWERIQGFRMAAVIHDLGKIQVPAAILSKPGRLTDEEYEIIQSHARHTLNILNKIRFDREKREIPMMAATHHERIDGKGYPLELSGDEIPEAGRIMAVGDVFDAITSRRHYRDRMDFLKVLNIMDGDSGDHFQPEFVDAFKRLPLARIVSILESGNLDPVSAEDMELFGQYTLQALHDLLKNRENLAEEDAHLVERFEHYYARGITDDHAGIDD